MSESFAGTSMHVGGADPKARNLDIMPAGSFAHLHMHSDYTLSKGASKVSELIKKAVSLRVPAVALVDEGNMYGAYDFSKEASKYGIQPIIGTKLWIALDDKGTKGSIILLAQNAVGYTNICSILAASHRPHEGTAGGEALIDLTTIESSEQSVEGIIALTGGLDGCVYKFLQMNRDNDARDFLDSLRYYFCDRLYVEVVRCGDETAVEVEIEERLIDMAYCAPETECADGVARTGVPLVASSEIWYATEDRNDAFELLRAVDTKTHVKITDEGVVARSARRFHMRDFGEMEALFADIPHAFENTALIARRCSFMVEGRNPILPPFETEGGRTEDEELRVQSEAGLVNRIELMSIPEHLHAPYRERLEFELGIISGMGFPGYFLIVSDFIKWAKAQGIPVGPGRGSGAGSLVAYALEITNIDPIPHGLLFERFLNPERVSMPDFDIDFCQDRREEVIQYVVRKYGSELVSLIATFGEIKSKTAIKDVGRVATSDDFGTYGFGELDRLTKLVPMDKAQPKKLKDAMNDAENPAFREMVDSDLKYKLLIENSLKVEGLLRTQGSHAAGVIIGGVPLHTVGPMGWDHDKSMPVSQFNMKAAEAVGFVKFDFLGLKTLSVLREAVEHVKNTTGVEINLDTLPLDDAATYEMLGEGLTNGVFQFEGGGMKKWMKAMKPERFADLVALSALYRPGPMDTIPHYVDCKNGNATPVYPEPVDRTQPYLEETYGIMVYQEQVMQVAQVAAGYSLGKADLLRRAIGKKIASEMVAQRKMFIEGAVEQGSTPKKAEALFDLIQKFADYGFNKSHAAAYSLISYHTAYLKKHYPAQFIAAIMTYDAQSPEKMAGYKEDMDHFGVPMLPPDINKSYARFMPEEYQPGKFGVRFGLMAIKQVSGDMPLVIEERRKGEFKSLEDFYKRAGAQFNKGQFEKIAEAGGFDLISKNRASAVNVLSFLARGGKKVDVNQTDLFGGMLDVAVPAETSDIPEWGNRVDREFKAVGFYFGEHPMERYESKLRKIKVKRKASLIQWMRENDRAELTAKRLSGMVEDYNAGITKKGNPYVSGKFSEKNDSFDVFFTGERHKLDEIQQVLRNAKLARRPVVVVGKVVIQDNDNIRIYGDDAFDAESLMAAERGRIRIIVDRDSVIPSSDEQQRIRTATASEERGEIGHDDVEIVRATTRMDAMKRKAVDIRTTVARLRNDDDGLAVEVLITLRMGEVETNIAMDGKYLIDQAAENSLKSIDGVVAVTEEV